MRTGSLSTKLVGANVEENGVRVGKHLGHTTRIARVPEEAVGHAYVVKAVCTVALLNLEEVWSVFSITYATMDHIDAHLLVYSHRAASMHS